MIDLIYTLSQVASTWLGRVADVLPLGFAFGAGMLATVNPCGFGMLPAYLGLYLGTDEERFSPASVIWRFAQALVIAVVMSAGFVVLFGVTGLIMAAGGHFVIEAFPWIGLSIGVLLVALGDWMVMGRALYTSLTERLGTRPGAPSQKGIRGLFMFGVAYGIASLSCTQPIFLSVVGSVNAVQDYLFRVTQFVSYALGMGFVISMLTLGLALFKGAVVGLLRQTLPYFQAFSAVLLLLAGIYIVYYWLTLGQLGQNIF